MPFDCQPRQFQQQQRISVISTRYQHASRRLANSAASTAGSTPRRGNAQLLMPALWCCADSALKSLPPCPPRL